MYTRISYLYRDAGNYKVHNEAYVAGVFTDKEKALIRGTLLDGEYFIPCQVGLPEKRFETWDSEADHNWFELMDFETTDEIPAGHYAVMTAQKLLQRFLAAKGNWVESGCTHSNESAVNEELMIPVSVVKNYLLECIKEWEGLGEQKHELANIQVLNHVKKELDDLNAFVASMDPLGIIKNLCETE